MIFITVVVRNHCRFVMMPVFLIVVCRPAGRVVSGVDMCVLL